MKKILLALFLAISANNTAAYADVSLIRDAEIEKTLADYAAPVFKAAGINKDEVRFFIVNDPDLNAFTAGGLNLFINTGLILKTENANQLIGVMAHETGHIAGGHIVKRMGQIDKLSTETIVATVLGAAVSVAGLPEAGIAVLAGGQHLTERTYLRFSREQEVSADQFALTFLKKTHQSAQGLLDVMEILRRDEVLGHGDINPYTISHPLSQERIGHIRSEIMDEAGNVADDKFSYQHQRMVAKLYGFLESPDSTFGKYTDNSEPSIYARSIAYFKQSDFPTAIAEIDKLIAKHPNDPFYNELKGQFLAEGGKPNEAIAYYKKAADLYPNSYLLESELGSLYLNKDDVNSAIDHLTKASRLEKSATTFHQLAGAYGKLQNNGMMNLFLAEEASLLDKNAESRNYAKEAKKDLPKQSAGWIRANDLLADIKLQKDKDKDKDKE